MVLFQAINNRTLPDAAVQPPCAMLHLCFVACMEHSACTMHQDADAHLTQRQSVATVHTSAAEYSRLMSQLPSTRCRRCGLSTGSTWQPRQVHTSG